MLTAKQFTKKVFELVKADHFLPVTEHQVYSTAETKVGVWTDGKPIYRKTINVGNVTATYLNTTTVSFGVEVETLVSLKGTGKQSNGASITIPNGLITGSGSNTNDVIRYATEFRSFSTTSVAIMVGEMLGNLTDVKVTVEYTKTTDTASTPKVPYESLHEWSTEEKLVGYWVDGKAVYEKTVSIGAMPNATTKTVAHGISNIGMVIDARGYMTTGSGVDAVLPYTGNTSTHVSIRRNGANIEVTSDFNASTFSGHVTLRYTKTT